jgi:hypothetical protein
LGPPSNRQGPGARLFLAHQWNNVLFDFAVSGLRNLLGLKVAEKIVVSAVRIFFWGTFLLACSASYAVRLKTVSWFLCLCIAVLAHGSTFEMGTMEQAARTNNLAMI